MIKSQLVRQRVLDGKLVMVRLADGIETLSDVTVKITAKQKAVVELLLQAGQASLKEVCYFAAAGKSVVDRLETAGVVQYYTREVYRSPYAAGPARDKMCIRDSAAVETQLAAGRNVLLEIEVQGAMKVRRTFPQAVFIFVLPPS